MLPGGGLLSLKSLGRWTPCRTLLKRGFAQERPTSNDDEKLKDSAAEKTTTQHETNTDSDSGEIPTPSLLKATSTEDFFNSTREQRLRQKEKRKDGEADVMKQQEPFLKRDLDSG